MLDALIEAAVEADEHRWRHRAEELNKARLSKLRAGKRKAVKI